MLGVYDYYKAVKDNGDVLLQSFNIAGGLGWGRRIAFPTRIIDAEHSRNSTAMVTFDRGWALSFRLHNAESRAVLTVKFDVNLIGTPTQANHTIRYGGDLRLFFHPEGRKSPHFIGFFVAGATRVKALRFLLCGKSPIPPVGA